MHSKLPTKTPKRPSNYDWSTVYDGFWNCDILSLSSRVSPHGRHGSGFNTGRGTSTHMVCVRSRGKRHGTYESLWQSTGEVNRWCSNATWPHLSKTYGSNHRPCQEGSPGHRWHGIPGPQLGQFKGQGHLATGLGSLASDRRHLPAYLPSGTQPISQHDESLDGVDARIRNAELIRSWQNDWMNIPTWSAWFRFRYRMGN